MITDVLGYIYDADIHCDDCATARFGVDSSGYIYGVDSEGNDVGVQFDDDSWVDLDDDERQQMLGCGDCGTILDARCRKCLNSVLRDEGDAVRRATAPLAPVFVYSKEWKEWALHSPLAPEYCHRCTRRFADLVPLA
jgi:hypothetical protein